GPWTRASVADRVAACLPAFELVEDGDADYKALDAFTLVAQNTWNGGVVLGAPVTAWRGVDLERAVTRAWLNDEPAGQGKTGDALGHPFEAVAWLANLLNRRGRMLGRDMIVMTGSSITTKFPSPGDRVRFAIDGLGDAALEGADECQATDGDEIRTHGTGSGTMRRREVIGFAGTTLFAWPLIARAQQQAKSARLGFVGFGTPAATADRVEALRAGLRDLGYVE